jgi:hypothetical protein
MGQHRCCIVIAFPAMGFIPIEAEGVVNTAGLGSGFLNEGVTS